MDTTQSVGHAGNNQTTSSGVKALLNSCLYPSSARSCWSALSTASLLAMVMEDIVVDEGTGISRLCLICKPFYASEVSSIG